jgi:hypothetical protein
MAKGHAGSNPLAPTILFKNSFYEDLRPPDSLVAWPKAMRVQILSFFNAGCACGPTI